MNFEPVIGLEVHAQILTQSKMFCTCSADFFGAPPNTHVCPVCLGMPGTLPVINQAAIAATIRTALALHCEIPAYAKFDRKNYHYPDLMKGYQISQYDLPLSRNGWLTLDAKGETKRVRIRRVHLEEDTAKLLHYTEFGIDNQNQIEKSSFVDVNRAGVPLMEIVSEPDLQSLQDVKQYSENLRQLLRYLGVSTGDMEKGAMRFEANISLRPAGTTELSKTRVEIKNLNSFRGMLSAVEFEIARQEKILHAGGMVEQETMGWDDARGTTIPQRSKEEANDYRYFPEPDLPRLEISRAWVEEIRAGLPELPDEKRARYVNELKLTTYDAGVITAEKETADFFEAAVKVGIARGVSPKAIANWLTNEIFARTKGDLKGLKITPQKLVGLIARIYDGSPRQIDISVAKSVLDQMMETGQDADSIIDAQGLGQAMDFNDIAKVVETVIRSNQKPVADYLAGKEGIWNYLLGQVAKEVKGKASAASISAVLRTKLDKLRNPS